MCWLCGKGKHYGTTVPRAPTAIAVIELPGAESLLGEDAAKSIFVSPNATPREVHASGAAAPANKNCVPGMTGMCQQV